MLLSENRGRKIRDRDYKIRDNSKAFAVNERNEAMITGGGVVSFVLGWILACIYVNNVSREETKDMRKQGKG